MLQRAKEFFRDLPFPGKVMMTGLVLAALSWVPLLLYLVFVYGLLGVKDGNPIGLGLLMMFGSVLGGAMAGVGLILLLISNFTGRS